MRIEEANKIQNLKSKESECVTQAERAVRKCKKMMINSQIFSIRRRSKLYRVFRVAIRHFLYALKSYNIKFSSIIASDARTKEISGRAISVCEAVISNNNNLNDNINHSVSDIIFVTISSFQLYLVWPALKYSLH